MRKKLATVRLLKLAYRLKQFRQSLSYNSTMDYDLWLRYLKLVCKLQAIAKIMAEEK